LVYMTAHTSGGHVNCAVTFAMVLSGDVDPATGVCYLISQVLGSIAGAALLALVFKKEDDLTKAFGTNAVNPERDYINAWFGEALCTYLLVTVIYQTATHSTAITRVHPEAPPSFAPIPIGLAVFFAHLILITLDGCSINPTRTLGPAIIGAIRYNSDVFDAFYIFMCAPLIGAGLAAGQEVFMRRLNEMETKVEMQSNEELQMTNTTQSYPQKQEAQAEPQVEV